MLERDIKDILSTSGTLKEEQFTPDLKQKIKDMVKESIFCSLYRHTHFLNHCTEDVFKVKKGVFVTLYKDGHVRGCYGSIRPHYYLASGVSIMAKGAGESFPWIGFVNEEELKNLEVEVSIVDKVRKIESYEELEPDVDGLHVETVIKQHDFLPRMWKRYWDKKYFFSNNMVKAKMGPEDLDRKEFTAIAFTIIKIK